MIKEYEYKGHKWIDLENPSESEIARIINDFDVPVSAAEDLLSPTPKQRVVMYEKCVYIVLHFPTLTDKKNKPADDHRQEIDFIIGKDYLITVHYDEMKSINAFSKSLNIKDDTVEVENAGFIFHKLIKHLYHSLLKDVEKIKEDLHRAENFVFKGEEKRMVVELSRIHRDILRFNHAILPHREAIAALHNMFKEFLGEKYEYFIHDMASEYQRVDRRMHANKELLEELRHTNDSLLSTKQNEAIKGLTMMAFITFPLTLCAAIFTIPSNHTPLIGSPYDFDMIMAIMLAIVLGCFGYFSYKKWL
ncbi:MAG: Mg2 transporter protein CorA family protein magnesium transporter [Candidatus Taylorbacteria bacterium]|nr:Mg2 transporter protein CorA family protein magnesium transporter [Candidatus Taylorbacteria bacterium]